MATHFFDFDFVGAELHFLFFKLVVKAVELRLQSFYLGFLLLQLQFKALLLEHFVLFGFVELFLESFEISLGVQSAVGVHVGFLVVRMDFLRALLLLLFDEQAHLATLVFQNNQLLVLHLHGFFVVTLFKL